MADDYSSRIKKIAAQQRKGGGSSYAAKIQKIAQQQSGSSGVNWKAAAAGASSSEPKEKGPVAWVLDILDRPGNAFRSGAAEGFRAEKKSLDAGKSGPQAFVDALGGSVKGSIEGLTGKQHNTTSQIIEQYTDMIGPYQNPDYKDVKDNVNPWVKGIGGFVGDVVTDPLTYVPGVDLVSVTGKVIKGVKAGGEAVKALETGATAAEKATAAVKAGGKAFVKPKAAKAAEQATKTQTKVSEDLMAQIAEQQAPKAAAAAPSPVPVAPKPEPINPSDLKPAVAEAPEPTALSKQDWATQQLADQPDTLKVGKTDTTPDNVRRVLADDTAELTSEEVRNARAWARRNLSDDAYSAYQKSFKGSVSKAAPEAQAAVAAVSKAAPERVDQRVLAALADASKNIARGARKTDNLDFNEIDQSRLLSGSTKDGIPGLVRRHVEEKGHANGQQQNFARFQNVVRDSKAVLDQMEQRGVPASVGGTPMRADEVLQHIGEANQRSAAFLVNGTGRTNMDTVLQAARDAAHSSLSDDELYAALFPRIYKATAKAGGQLEKVSGGQQALPGYRVSAKEIANDLTQAIVAKRSAFADDVATKSSYWAERRGEQTVNISNAVLKSLRDVQENGTPGQYLQALASIERDTKAYGKSVGAVAGAAEDATAAVVRQVPEVDIKVAKGSAQAVDEAVKAVATKPMRPAVAIDAAQMAAKPGAKRQFEAVIDEVEEDIADYARKSGTDLEDFGPKAAQQYIAGLGSMLYGGMSKFKADFVAGKYFGLYTGAQSLTHNYLGSVTKGLTKFSKGYSPEVRQGALRALQTGAAPADQALAQATEELRPLVDRLFNLSDPDSLINDSFLRQGANMNEVNRFIRHDAYRIDLDAATERASRNGTDLLQEVSQQWKYMDIADPVDYVMHMHQAMIDQAGVHSMAQTFTKHAFENRLASATPKAGFVKVRPEKDSYLGRYLDEDAYYDKNAIRAFRDVDRLIGEMRNVNRVPGIIKSFDTVQNMWKVGMTSLRPGFHIRNGIGDTGLTLMDVGIIKPQNVTKAMKVLHAHKTYEGFDAIKVLRNAGESELVGKGDKVLDLKFRGGRQSLTNEDVYRLARDEGLLAEFGHLEGLIDDSQSALRKGAEVVGRKTGFNKVVQGANFLATYESHHARMVHFLELMERNARKFDNPIALAEYAARRVKRFHPDPSMLSPFEKKYMRRIIPFYSWQRAMIPLIAESLLTRPGRVMMYPKASYNMAVSLGVDPYSISQPFPEDEQFPSFITEQATGPVANINGKNYSIAPGIAQVDVLNDYVGANPLRTTAGALTPAIKAPIELLSGTNLQTGGKIKSPSEYILGQIPGVNYVSRAAANGSEEGQQNDPEANQTLLMNWLSGLGIQNLNKPSYQRYAQYEQSQKQNGNG